MRIKKNYLLHNNKKYKCAIGCNGFSSTKKEGDGCTPSGIFHIEAVYYRKDKIKTLNCAFEKFVIDILDGWCDEVNHPQYNQKIRFPFSHSAERLHRNDNLYDLLCVLDFNQNPVVSGMGSAIFIHIAPPNYEPTEGCIALKKEDLLAILKNIKKDEKIIINP